MAMMNSTRKPPRRQLLTVRLAAIGFVLAMLMGSVGSATAANLRFDRGAGAGDDLQYTQKFDPCAAGGRFRGQQATQDPTCPDGEFSQQQQRRDPPRRPGSSAFGLQFDYQQN